MPGARDYVKRFRSNERNCLSGGNFPPVPSPRRQQPIKEAPLVDRLERLGQILPANSRRASMIQELLPKLREDASRLSSLNPGNSSSRRILDQIKSGREKASRYPWPCEPMEHYHDAFHVDGPQQMTAAEVDQRKAYIEGRKARLLDHYHQSQLRPAGASPGPKDDRVVDMLEGYDRRQLELEWRQPGSGLHSQLLLGKEYKKALTKFTDDAYGEETACGEKEMERRMMTLMHRMHKLGVLQRHHQGDYPDDVIADAYYFPSHLMDAMQAKVNVYEKELLKLRQSPEEYQEAVAQFTEDAYGEETACGKQDMGKRKIELMQRINKLAVLEKKNRGVYRDDVICAPADRPAALICAMQGKVDVYEEKLEMSRPAPHTVIMQNASQMRKGRRRMVLPDRTKCIDLIPEDDSGLENCKPAKKQYSKTKKTPKLPKEDKCLFCNRLGSTKLMPLGIREVSQTSKEVIPCRIHGSGNYAHRRPQTGGRDGPMGSSFRDFAQLSARTASNDQLDDRMSEYERHLCDL